MIKHVLVKALLAAYLLSGFRAPAATILYSANFYWSNTPQAQVNAPPGDDHAGEVYVNGWADMSETALLAGPESFFNRSDAHEAHLAIAGIAVDDDVKTYAPPEPSLNNDQLMYRGVRSGNSGNSLSVTIGNLGPGFENQPFIVLAYFVNTENHQYDGTYSMELDGDKRYGVATTSFSDPGDTGLAFSNAGQSLTLAGAGLVNYLAIEDLSGRDAFTFTVTNETGSRVILQGVQLVSVPEPASLLLAGLVGILVVVLFKMRRRSLPSLSIDSGPKTRYTTKGKRVLQHGYIISPCAPTQPVFNRRSSPT